MTITILDKAVAPWLPTDIAGCVSWYAADLITGLSDTDPVGTWPDENGNAYPLTQAVGASKPIYYIDQINGKPALYGDGTDDVIVNTAFSSAFTGEDLPYTFLYVARIMIHTDWRALGGIGRTGADSFYSALGTSGIDVTKYRFSKYNGANEGYQDTATSTANTNWNSWEVSSSGVAITVIRNAITLIDAQAQDIPSITVNAFSLFALWRNGAISLPLRCYIAEMVVCSAEISSADRTNWRTYVNGKYGL